MLTSVSLRAAYKDTGFAPSLDHGQDYREIDAGAMESLVSEVGPCPGDLFWFLENPCSHRAALGKALKPYNLQPTTITRLLYDTSTLSNDNGHTIALATRTNPLSPSVLTSDHYGIVFKTRAIYEQMLDALLALPGHKGSGVIVAGELHLYCTMMGSSGVGSVPFLFDHFAAAYTLGQFLDQEEATSRHPFTPMIPASLEPESENATSETWFTYWHPEDANWNWSYPLGLVVQANQTVSWQISTTEHVSTASSDTLPEEAAPWCARQLVLYKNIDDLVINDTSYYRPTASLRERNAPFNAFFFQLASQRDSVTVIVLWVIQVTVKRDLDRGHTHGDLRPSNDSDRKSTLDFDAIGRLRERARQAWSSAPGRVEVEVKYVLLVPHEPQSLRRDSRFDVEWRFPAEFRAQRGEVFVQFLDISSFCGPCPLYRNSDLDKCGVEDVIGLRVPPLTAPQRSGPTPSVEVVGTGSDRMEASMSTAGKRGRREVEAYEGRETEGEERKSVRKKAKPMD